MLGLLRRADLAADQGGEHFAACTIPPVALVELRHLLDRRRAPSAENPLAVEQESDDRGDEQHRHDRPAARPSARSVYSSQTQKLLSA